MEMQQLLIVMTFGVTWIVLVVNWYSQFQISKRIRQLIPNDGEGDLVKRLEELLGEFGKLKKREEALFSALQDLAEKTKDSVATMKILRYNPYGDVGGDQSFSLVLLDGHKDGLVLSSMHSRSGTRVYAKSVKAGIPAITLSNEESGVLKEALEGLI